MNAMTSQTVSRQFEELDPGVLVVCGDQGERSQICDLLEAEGFLARGVETGAEAEAALRLEDADLIILDGRLRDGGAMAVCRRLAVSYTAPIIMISDSADVTDRVIALEVGADDLLSRPFNSRELLARARALVRRSRALLSARIPGMDGGRRPVRGAQSWRIDAITRKLTGPTGDTAVLTPGEVALLYVFLARPGQPVTGEIAAEELPGLSANHFRTSIVRLRRKMMKAGFEADTVKTLRSGGYFMEEDVAALCAGSQGFAASPRQMSEVDRSPAL
jgi:two-component system OmpR family response regulator